MHNKTVLLCKNCKYCRPSIFMLFAAFEYASCEHPNNLKLDPVTGGKKYGTKFCANQRGYDFADRCGKDGRWFEKC